MKINLALDILGVRLGGLAVDLDLGDRGPAKTLPVAVTKPVKWLSAKWVRGMMG